jgi:type II secretory pathway pseudopilin PulG
MANMRAGVTSGRGFTYLGLLFATALLAVALALALQLWSTLDRRAREQQLLFVGAQFRSALMRYYAAAPPGGRREFPQSLDDLLRDRRYPETRRYLRKIFVDPLTGKADWGFVRGRDGAISGVYSKAAGVPIKTANFGGEFQFEGARSYAEWIFRVSPGAPAADENPRASDAEQVRSR